MINKKFTDPDPCFIAFLDLDPDLPENSWIHNTGAHCTLNKEGAVSKTIGEEQALNCYSHIPIALIRQNINVLFLLPIV